MTLVVPFILVVNCVRMATDEQFVRTVYDYGWVPDDRFGLTEQQRSGLHCWACARSSRRRRRASVCCERRGCQMVSRHSTRGRCRTCRTCGRRSRVRIGFRSSRWSRSRFSPSSVLCSARRALWYPLPSPEARCSRWSSQSRPALRRCVSYDTFETTFHWLFFEGETLAFRGDGHAPAALPGPFLARRRRRHRHRGHDPGGHRVPGRDVLGASRGRA